MDRRSFLAENGVFKYNGATASLVSDRINVDYEIRSASVYRERLYFSASVSGERAFQLWATDGTLSGTVSIANITDPNPLRDEREKSSDPEDFLIANSLLFFQAFDFYSEPSSNLYVTDGTPTGSRVVPGLPVGGEINFYPDYPVVFNNEEIAFSAERR